MSNQESPVLDPFGASLKSLHDDGYRPTGWRLATALEAELYTDLPVNEIIPKSINMIWKTDDGWDEAKYEIYSVNGRHGRRGAIVVPVWPHHKI